MNLNILHHIEAQFYYILKDYRLKLIKKIIIMIFKILT